MSNYVFGTNLSYRDYLQARSFEDSIKGEISTQTRSIIASNEQLFKEHIAVSESLRTAVSEGFEQLSFDVQALTDGVTELTAAFNWGFSELLTAVGRVNDTLEQLVKVAKTPAQTWAYEQFEIARDAFRQALYPESLEYLDRAINGHVGNTGYKLEYRFHYLLGTIRLGSSKNTADDILHLPDAERAFLAAAKYARQDEPKEAGRAFLAAGWAAYCQGKMEAATHYTQNALSLFPALGEAHFQLAKIHMHLGQSDGSLVPLRRAIELDRAYSIKAAADDDFSRHEPIVRGLMNTLRQELKQKVAELFATLDRDMNALQEQRAQEFHFAQFGDLSKTASALDDARRAASTETYFGYLDALSLSAQAEHNLKEAAALFPTRVRAEVKRLTAALDVQIREVQKSTCGAPPDLDTTFGVIMSIGTSASFLIGCGACNNASGFDASANAFFGTLIAGALMSAGLGLGVRSYQSNEYSTQTTEFNSQKAATLSSLNTERSRLQSIESDVQKRFTVVSPRS